MIRTLVCKTKTERGRLSFFESTLFSGLSDLLLGQIDSTIPTQTLWVKNKKEILCVYKEFSDYKLDHRKGSPEVVIGRLCDTAISHAQRACQVVKSFISLLGPEIRFRDLDLNERTWHKVWNNFQNTYSLLWICGLATPWLKFHTAALFALASGNELPKALWGQNPGMFLTGKGYVFLQHLIHSGPKQARHVLLLKKGFPPVFPVELQRSKEDLYKELGTNQRDTLDEHSNGSSALLPVGPYAELPYTNRLAVLSEECRRTARELFSGKKTELSVGLPSIKSHAENKRVGGGAFGLIGTELSQRYLETPLVVRERCHTWLSRPDGTSYTEDERKFLISLWDQSTEGKDWINRHQFTGHICYNYHPSPYEGVDWSCNCYETNERGSWYYPKTLLAVGQSGTREFIDFDDSMSNWVPHQYKIFRDYVHDKMQTVLCTENKVYPEALPEPLKVRMITRGPWLRYWLSKDIQKWTHGVLRKHPVFVAIGRPLEEDDLQRLLPRGHESFLSGDYKSATNLLHPQLSLACVREICRCGEFDDTLCRLYEECLVGSDIVSEDGSETKQVWGQLMGSPLSFPILCIVNAALNRYYLELTHGRSFLLRECPMLINGDDVVLRAPGGSYDLWKMIVDDGGLVPSVGKNYLHRDFCIINSTYYEYRECFWNEQFWECPSVNFGLLHPSEGGLGDVGQISQRLCKGFSYDFSDKLMSKFVGDKHVKSLLSRVVPGVSYYAAKALGGLGLKKTRRELISEHQQSYYSYIAENVGACPAFEFETVTDGSGLCLRRFLKLETCWDDFFLESFQPVNFDIGHYNSALFSWAAKAYEEHGGTIMDDIQNCGWEDEDGNWVRAWGHTSSYMPRLVKRYWKEHSHPWDELSLSSFPWVRRSVYKVERNETSQVSIKGFPLKVLD